MKARVPIREINRAVGVELNGEGILCHCLAVFALLEHSETRSQRIRYVDTGADEYRLPETAADWPKPCTLPP